MKLKGFEHVGVDDAGVVQVDTEAVQAEKAAAAEAEARIKSGKASPGVKVDRRAKLAPKPKMEAGPGDVELTEEHIEEAREELWVEGNQNPSEAQIKERARMGVFSTMPEEKLADNIIDAVLADTDSRQKIIEKVNQGLKTESVIQARREAVEREKAVKEEVSRRTAEVIRLAKEKSAHTSGKERIQLANELKVVGGEKRDVNQPVENVVGSAPVEIVENLPSDVKRVEAVSAAKPILSIENGQPTQSGKDSVNEERSSAFADRKYEVEQRRKWQEVDRVEALEQDRKREEVLRVEAIEQERKREEVERVAALEQKLKDEKAAVLPAAPEVLEEPQKESLRTVLRRMILGKK